MEGGIKMDGKCDELREDGRRRGSQPPAAETA